MNKTEKLVGALRKCVRISTHDCVSVNTLLCVLSGAGPLNSGLIHAG